MPNFAYPIRSLKGTHFTGAIATDAIAYEDITVPGCLAGVNGNARIRLKSIRVQSKENLAWELWLFGNSSHQVTSDLDLDKYIGFWGWAATDAKQIAAANQFYYYIDGLDVTYGDLNNTGALHIGLINRSVASKSAGAGGQIVVECVFDIEGA